MICAWIETSSAETARRDHQLRRSASARAISDPLALAAENSCGNRL